LYNATDKLTKGWLTHGAKLLQQVTASAKSGADAGDMLQRNASGSSTSSWQSACGDAFGHTMMDQKLSKLMQKTSGGPSKSFIGHGLACLHHTGQDKPLFQAVFEAHLQLQSLSQFLCCIVCSHMHVTLMLLLIPGFLGVCLVSLSFASFLKLVCCRCQRECISMGMHSRQYLWCHC